jgi:hypothetical protein
LSLGFARLDVIFFGLGPGGLAFRVCGFGAGLGFVCAVALDPVCAVGSDAAVVCWDTVACVGVELGEVFDDEPAW